MAPHADPADSATLSWTNQSDSSFQNGRSKSTIDVGLEKEIDGNWDCRSHLQHTQPDELHDLICVGFGPASLAIAIALHDALDNSATTTSLPQLPGGSPKVAFLERQSQFAWHAGMILPGAKMQITFIKDLATLRNPRSEFTFLNYLHRKSRLLQFTNLGTFLPQRVEYEDYMRWCANRFEEIVNYGQDVFEIVPEYTDNTITETVKYFRVKSKDTKTGAITERRARHVVVAAGGKPDIPKPLPTNHQRILHSAHYTTAVPSLLPDTQKPCGIAVIGSGQSAAEVFHNLQIQYTNSKTRLLIRGSCLRPSDDSPFVNEIFDPERIDTFYKQSASDRCHSISKDRCTNYGVVRLELLEAIYSTLYTQRLRYSEENQWPHQILTHSIVTGWHNLPNDRVALHVCEHRESNNSNGRAGRNYTLEADVVVVATGYRRDVHEDLLKPMRHLLPDPDRRIEVGRNYKVKFRDDAVSDDAGIWLQGCNEDTHGLSDTLLSVLATRGGEMVQSLFGGPTDTTCTVAGKNHLMNRR